MNISEPFIRRPIATSLLAVAILLGGGAAYTQLPVAPLPNVDFPTINVSASLPGANPRTMASAVATPLERRFGRIAGVQEITSTSTLGSTSITLQFSLDRDVDAAGRDVQAAINAAGGDLPPNLPSRPNYRKVNPADAPILILALTSQTLPMAQVYDVANNVLAQKIAQVDGVGQVFVGGGQQPAVRVQVDPAALAGVGLGLEDVRTALAQASIDRPKGVLNGPRQALSFAANDQLLDASQYEDIILTTSGGMPLRLGDVGRAFSSVENTRVAAWTDGERSISLIIRRQPGANILDVIERVKALLPSVSLAISPAIDVRVVLDRGDSIRASVADVKRTLVLSVVLVVLVVLVFLRSGRATVIPSIAVPLALIGTFGVMFLCGYSLDNLSLMALTISTGFVIDDAIVVTENIARYIEEGATPLEAALRGTKQVGFTIVSITASLLAVFIPLLLMGGIVGRLFREFAVTLSVAIAVSALVSLTLTPMMASRLLRRPKAEARGAFDRLLRAYDRALGVVLRHPTVTLLVFAATVAVNISLFITVPKGLFPQQDTGSLTGVSDGPQDISFQAMKERQEAANDIIRRHPAVSHSTAFIGGAGTLNSGNAFIQLKPRNERRQNADQVIAELRGQLMRIPGIQVFLQSVQDVRVGGRSARTQYQYSLQCEDLETLQAWAPRMLEKLRTLPELRDLASDQQPNGLQLTGHIDRDTASRLGVTPALIDQTLYDAFGQRQVSTLFTPTTQYRVVMEVDPQWAGHPDALAHLYVRPPGGAPVPLSTLVRFQPEATLLSVNHQGQFPSVTLSFNLAPGVALGQAVTAIQRARAELGLPATVTASFQGTAQVFTESLASEPYLVLAALAAVYIVLGILYESYVHPLTILSTLPSAGVGALLALWLFRMELSIIALIGIILLIGIVKKNGILMVDFALDAERGQGLSAREAIHGACLVRFRPILMTTLAALLGALPLALGQGSGSELRRPLGIAIVGGLVLSQVLTLFTTPVVYLELDRLARRRTRPVRR
ncbi:multidrug efflux RND transporter permease subunit [Pyxidicoccus parkwayensis]|uniref:Multidrug efflux RND transporter permease subunit n=1 Tax=Pyxidicoccus parkwayensis TaxID=2813578 RepID=A0ABX7NXD2_9BACT|nr:multidrug efflux RND transporter permease subunit [Pyxidicoccus parkwaysis]QSQ23534.1 multidrug efflux RND transporter permease subunit [Pyxidicoccus parkwaysis]